MPTPNETLLLKFRSFVGKWLSETLTPLDPDTDVSFDTWIKEINQTDSRKKELIKCWPETDRVLSRKDIEVKAFAKDETYGEYKPTRWINARADRFKCYAGPFIRALEKVIYQLEWFIKKVPVKDRPAYIKERLYRVGAKYFTTDFSTFEATFKQMLLDACEFQLFDYMFQHVPGGPEFCDIYREVIGGRNTVKSKFFTILVNAIRMSGEMSTSLGNGFTNLMFMLFLFSEANCTDLKASVEGDDGLGSFRGTPPTTEDYEKLGANIKLEIHEELSTASFCGIVFHPNDMINLTDPREVLCSFGWTSERYAKASNKNLMKLLRCKALSLAHQYPGCPVITALARYALRVTRQVRNYIPTFAKQARCFSQWDRDQLLDAIADLPHDETKIPIADTGIDTRMLCEKLYKIPLLVQFEIEKYLDEKNDISPLIIPSIGDHMHEHWKHYWDNYVMEEQLSSCTNPTGLVRYKPRWDLA